MKSEKLVLMGICLFLVSSVLAVQTTVIVKTDYTVDIRIYNTEMQKVYEDLRDEPENGEISFDYISGTEDPISIATFFKGEDNEGNMGRFDDLDVGGEIIIDLTLEEPEVLVKEKLEEVKNETEEIIIPEINETQETEESINVSEENETTTENGIINQTIKGLVTTTLYGVGIGFLLLMGLLMMSKRSKKNNTESFTVRKMSEMPKKEDSEINLDETEKRLQVAEEEIKRIKERNTKMKQAQDNFIKAKEELDRLRKEDSFN
jgi:hypothetical protein